MKRLHRIIKNDSDASIHTKKLNNELLGKYPFDDTQDFINADRGLIVTCPDDTIVNDQGDVVWEFPKLSDYPENCPETVNPSLWRQARLNARQGIFKVTEGIYQARGFDICTMSFIRGKTGWIVVDPLTSQYASKKALEMVQEHVEDIPVQAILVTHSHGDHFGGIRGVYNDGIEVVAPLDFVQHSVAENVLAGDIMNRRAVYQFGNVLPKGALGIVDTGLGHGLNKDDCTFVRPTKIIKEDLEKVTIDGVDFEFMICNGTEAPSEFIFYIPKLKAFCGAEVICQTQHNLSTLRGAKTRDAALWVTCLDNAVHTFGIKAEVMFNSHHWPTWGRANIVQYMETYRDTFKFIHDQTLRYANRGHTPEEIAELVELPQSILNVWGCHGYYGSVSHNVRAVYDFYLGGWWDGNPFNLDPLPVKEESKVLMEAMVEGDPYRIAKRHYDDGKYREALTILKVLVNSKGDAQSKQLAANCFEQLGFQAESANWRNYYLTGAMELRQGYVDLKAISTGDIVKEFEVGHILDALAVKLDPSLIEDVYLTGSFTTNGKTHVFELTNGTLIHRAGKVSGKLQVDVDVEVLGAFILGGEVNHKSFKTNDKELLKDFLELFDTAVKKIEIVNH